MSYYLLILFNIYWLFTNIYWFSLLFIDFNYYIVTIYWFYLLFIDLIEYLLIELKIKIDGIVEIHRNYCHSIDFTHDLLIWFTITTNKTLKKKVWMAIIRPSVILKIAIAQGPSHTLKNTLKDLDLISSSSSSPVITNSCFRHNEIGVAPCWIHRNNCTSFHTIETHYNQPSTSIFRASDLIVFDYIRD